MEMENLELGGLQRFKRLLDVFPQGETVRAEPPAPDFVIVGEHRRIGIELTQAFWDAQLRGSVSRRDLARWEDVLKSAREEWLRRGYELVSIDVTWRVVLHGPPKDAEAVKSLVSRLVEALEKLLPEVGDTRIVSRRNPDGRLLPPEVAVLGIYVGFDAEWNTTWVSSIPRLQSRHIQRECDRKHSRLAGYRDRCDEVWLVIWVDWSAPGSSFTPPRNPQTELRVTTGFDRVFFLDTDELFEVGTESSSPTED